jgi:hypothetical protein
VSAPVSAQEAAPVAVGNINLPTAPAVSIAAPAASPNGFGVPAAVAQNGFGENLGFDAGSEINPSMLARYPWMQFQATSSS